jgi:hypothetical protein
MTEIDKAMERYEHMTQEERKALRAGIELWLCVANKAGEELVERFAALTVSATPPEPRLTLEAAKAIAEKALGTSEGIERGEFGGDTYIVRVGRLWCEIRPDIYSANLVEVMALGAGGATYLLYDPATLEEDADAEKRVRPIRDTAAVRYWIKQNGADECRALIEEVCGT